MNQLHEKAETITGYYYTKLLATARQTIQNVLATDVLFLQGNPPAHCIAINTLHDGLC